MCHFQRNDSIFLVALACLQAEQLNFTMACACVFVDGK